MRPRVAIATLLALLVVAPNVRGQQARESRELRIERADGEVSTAAIALDHGYAAVPVSLFQELGWTVTEDGDRIRIAVPNEIAIDLQIGTPFFTWDEIALQLADAPYREGRAFVPLQLLVDFLPRRLPDLYEFDGARSVLRAGDPMVGEDSRAQADAEPVLTVPSEYEGPRVVIIDAGHGGADPGATGVGGVREKDVALSIALDLAEVLRRDPKLEVHLIRDDDTFVELWDRGQIATNIKGDRPGAVFVSIHGNSFLDQRATRGFETYFLSEARTEHERRVAAIENAPLRTPGQVIDPDEEPDLSFIFGELRNLDNSHWSALLAEMIQDEVSEFHPGPNRGVKQGVLAVLTNALMPSVLVEIGYLSNPDESRLLSQPDFQAEAADGIARAVERFFERYPPGSGSGQ